MSAVYKGWVGQIPVDTAGQVVHTVGQRNGHSSPWPCHELWQTFGAVWHPMPSYWCPSVAPQGLFCFMALQGHQKAIRKSRPGYLYIAVLLPCLDSTWVWLLIKDFSFYTYMHGQFYKIQSHIVYLDYKKAFDSVPHQQLLYKLSKYGICDKVLQWITNFLTKWH